MWLLSNKQVLVLKGKGGEKEVESIRCICDKIYGLIYWGRVCIIITYSIGSPKCENLLHVI